MRDYKNVKVPRSYRSSSNRATVKRVSVGRAAGRPRTGGTGIRHVVAADHHGRYDRRQAACWPGRRYQALLHAQMFQIAGVDVKGAKQLSEADLKEIAGVFTGQNIFKVDLETPVRRARANPWVKDVRIYRRLPNRISMVVTERVAFALLDTGAGRYLMDSDGVVIERVAKDDASAWQLPVVAVKEQPRPARRTGDVRRHGRGADAPQRDRRPGRVEADRGNDQGGSPETLSVLYADHEFKIGTGNYTEKLRRLAEILSDGTQRGLDIAYVDLRPERQAAVMVKNSRVQSTKARVKGKKI